MSEFDNGCPVCGGIFWHLPDCPCNDNYSDCSNETVEFCTYCAEHFYPLDSTVKRFHYHDPNINEDKVCCVDCLRYFIENQEYDEAIFLLRNRDYGYIDSPAELPDTEPLLSILEEAYKVQQSQEFLANKIHDEMKHI